MKTWLYLIAIFAVLLVATGAYFFTRGPTSLNSTSTGPNIFTGRIVGDTLAPGSYDNVPILSDEGCTIDPKTELSNCTTSFATTSGRFSFNYEHNMMMQPCLSIGDKVNVQVSADGSATIDRTYWAGGGA